MDPNNRKLPKSPTSSDAAGVGLPRPSPPPLLPLSPPRKEPCDCAQSSPPPQPVPDTTLTPWWMKRAPGSGKVRLGGESEKEGRGTRKREEIKRKGEKTRRGWETQRCEAGSPDSAALPNRASLDDQKTQGTATKSRVLWLAAASSTHSPQPLALPLFSLLGARPLRRALPRPFPHLVFPPPSGEQETRGLAEDRQVGEAGQGEGVTLDSSAQVHLTAVAGTSGAP